jgi:hypothetical protein
VRIRDKLLEIFSLLIFSRKDRAKNDEIRRPMRVDGNIIQELQSSQLTWYEHVQRMADNRLPKQAVQWKPPWRKKKGRPKLTWIDNIKER